MSATPAQYYPSDEIVRKACDPQEYGNNKKYPFIRYLPLTTPSVAAQQALAESLANKAVRDDLASIPVEELRKKFLEQFHAKYKPHFPAKNVCSIVEERINNVPCHWVIYNGSCVQNGVVICCHGGAYVLLDVTHNIPFAALISKLTGFACLCVDYKLAPEYKLPYCVNELIDVYDYLLNGMHLSSNRIAMTGDSAGGGMILLALQSMKYGAKSHRNLASPACVWLNSPWTDLGMCLTNDTCRRNLEYDAGIGGGALEYLAELATKNKKQMNSSEASPILGEFKGLCPMYFMVGATEILLDDSVLCANRAWQNGVDVKLDISPYMNHVWAVDVFHSEGVFATVRGCEWMEKYFAPLSKL